MRTSKSADVQDLISILSSLEGFDWDDGNMEKNRKHGVEQFEIEQVFFNPPSLVITDSKHSLEESQWKIFGKTSADRFLVVVFTIRKRLIRPISARAMNRKEREYYEEEIKKSPAV